MNNITRGIIMEVLKKFIIDNSAQIWTLVSVVVGGVVTYISTSASERRKNKRQSQKENLEQVLIPYCTCLEQTIARINKIYQEPIELFTEQYFEKWLNALGEPLVYLEAAKRVFLSQSMREKLKNYKLIVDTFSTAIEQECTNCLIKYKSYISSKLEHFPNVPAPMLITFSMDKGTDVKVKIAIVNKSNLSLINNFSAIDFIKNDEPENYRHTSITLNKEVRDTWGAINYGIMDISNVGNPEVELACILLDYIEENIYDEREILSRIIDETQGANMLRAIIDELNEMLNELVKNIDKITN